MTTPTQMRLTADDRRKLEEIRDWAGLPSLAATVRYCAGQVHIIVFGRPEPAEKKSKKRA